MRPGKVSMILWDLVEMKVSYWTTLIACTPHWIKVLAYFGKNLGTFNFSKTRGFDKTFGTKCHNGTTAHIFGVVVRDSKVKFYRFYQRNL